MKDLFENIRDNLICRRKRSLMMRTYLSGKYFMFDKKIKTTTNKGTKIILLSLIGLISLLILVFGIKRSSNETNDIEKD